MEKFLVSVNYGVSLFVVNKNIPCNYCGSFVLVNLHNCNCNCVLKMGNGVEKYEDILILKKSQNIEAMGRLEAILTGLEGVRREAYEKKNICQ